MVHWTGSIWGKNLETKIACGTINDGADWRQRTLHIIAEHEVGRNIKLIGLSCCKDEQLWSENCLYLQNPEDNWDSVHNWKVAEAVRDLENVCPQMQ